MGVLNSAFLKTYLYFSLRWESAAELCRSLLELCPKNCQLLESLATLYLHMEQSDNAYKVWIGAFEKNPQNAEIFYRLCKFLVSQVILHSKTHFVGSAGFMKFGFYGLFQTLTKSINLHDIFVMSSIPLYTWGK